MPAHLASIFTANGVSKQRAIRKKKNDFVVSGPGGRDVDRRTRNSPRAPVSSFLARIPCVTHQCLRWAPSFIVFLKGVHFDRISHCWGPCRSGLSLSKCKSCVVLFLKEPGPPRSLGGGVGGGVTRQARRDRRTSPGGGGGGRQLPKKGKWVSETVLCEQTRG